MATSSIYRLLFLLFFFLVNQKRGWRHYNVPMAKRPNSLFCASTTSDFVRLSFVRTEAVLPPYKNALRLQKIVPFHFTFKKLCSVLGYLKFIILTCLGLNGITFNRVTKSFVLFVIIYKHFAFSLILYWYKSSISLAYGLFNASSISLRLNSMILNRCRICFISSAYISLSNLFCNLAVN